MGLARWFYKLPLRLRSLFHRHQVEGELNDELQFHLERQIEEHIAHGLTPEEARRRALVAIGGIEQRKEEIRDTRGLNLLDNLAKDLRYAVRMILRNPSFAIAAVATIALGIGVNTALFSVYNAVALRPLPVAQPDRVVRLKRWFDDGSRGDQQYAFSYREYQYMRDHNDVFDSMVASSSAP